MVGPMDITVGAIRVHICMSGLLPNHTGNIKNVTDMVTTMVHPNGLAIAMGGRMIDFEEISEEKVVEERVVIVGDAGRKCFKLSILNTNRFKKNLATLNPWGLLLTGFLFLIGNFLARELLIFYLGFFFIFEDGVRRFGGVSDWSSHSSFIGGTALAFCRR